MILLIGEEFDRISAARVAAMHGCVVVAAGGRFAGDRLAAALASDWWIATSGSSFEIDGSVGPALLRRAGPAARRLLLGAQPVDAAAALEIGMVDQLVTSEADLADAARRWVGERSAEALDSAAELIRRHGGDALERAEFARLFGSGTPQEGLRAFLEKRRPRF